MKPNLQRGNYDGAIQQAAADAGLVLAGSAPEHPTGSGSIKITPGAWLGIGFLLVWLSVVAGGWWYGSNSPFWAWWFILIMNK